MANLLPTLPISLILDRMTWFGQTYYEDTGTGDPVVLLPGWAGSITDLNVLRGTLADGFRVIAVDLPGSGQSQPQPRHYEPLYYQDDAGLIHSLLDDLGIGAAHLVGFSDGGEVALVMAAARPRRTLSVFTWGASGFITASPLLGSLAQLLDDPVDQLKPLAAYLVEKYGTEGARVMSGTWARAMSAIISAGGDISRSRAGLVTCPALLVNGSDDPFCPAELVRETASLLPNGRYRQVAGGGHDLHLSHIGWLKSTLSTWLASH